MFFLLKTKNGYQLDEVVSALQKSIRRGLERDALFWALELCPKFENYLWRRLLVVAYEDVSALVPGIIPVSISVMKKDYFEFREKGDSACLLVLTSAILLMCRSPKARIADNLLLTLGYAIDDGYRPEIPDFALDKHTRRGRSMGRDGSHFIEEGALLDPISETVDDPYKAELEKAIKNGRWGVSEFVWASEKKKKDKKEKEELVTA